MLSNLKQDPDVEDIMPAQIILQKLMTWDFNDHDDLLQYYFSEMKSNRITNGFFLILYFYVFGDTEENKQIGRQIVQKTRKDLQTKQKMSAQLEEDIKEYFEKCKKNQTIDQVFQENVEDLQIHYEKINDKIKTQFDSDQDQEPNQKKNQQKIPVQQRSLSQMVEQERQKKRENSNKKIFEENRKRHSLQNNKMD